MSSSKGEGSLPGSGMDSTKKTLVGRISIMTRCMPSSVWKSPPSFRSPGRQSIFIETEL